MEAASPYAGGNHARLQMPTTRHTFGSYLLRRCPKGPQSIDEANRPIRKLLQCDGNDALPWLISKGHRGSELTIDIGANQIGNIAGGYTFLSDPLSIVDSLGFASATDVLS